ncbi:3-dehydroquinate synthase [Thermofilum pendens Hrk 5]|uniref:Glycerol-1-phosphate dehydrogenase [NAD(P)+] n=1 Tax=Thermofilum pendens (strain DSM 2475 / Hrk 5) TaxID=368408 RepID=G1PDH_THEPD|nr:RecName: Full=Glycerol-1-phosphate dehydrogenase [NAD(P)+]; Short=G1P dehydrogenase; Short=G1PDH; AltName: Full=Enantiomeric glycerophosphate synthase; AltName: Full=sn-glycerol-1-phosphate dehydrogenase [Thermofilum pendens Hrk 5]ABL78629.1 3-dehydroquinate synthase [Thermofilum pendens Hrk 5]
MRAELPKRVVVERGALQFLPEVLRELGCSKTVVVTDSGVWSVVGSVVEGALRGLAYEVVYIEAADNSNVERARSAARRVEACAVAGLGGGRPVDVAKYAAFMEGLPFVSVPTAISHDGFASPIVALKDPEGNPLSIFTRPPAAVLVDLAVVSRAPRRLLASGVGDIVGKVTSVADARLAQRLTGEEVPEVALRMAETAARMVLDEVDEIASWTERGVGVLAQAGLLAGMAMAVAGSSRPCSGSEHLFSHSLDKYVPWKKSLHGEQVGVGAIIASYLHGFNWRVIRDALAKVGAPTTVEGLGVTGEDAVRALLKARELRKRFTILDVVELNEGLAWKVLRETGVAPTA